MKPPRLWDEGQGYLRPFLAGEAAPKRNGDNRHVRSKAVGPGGAYGVRNRL